MVSRYGGLLVLPLPTNICIYKYTYMYLFIWYIHISSFIPSLLYLCCTTFSSLIYPPTYHYSQPLLPHLPSYLSSLTTPPPLLHFNPNPDGDKTFQILRGGGAIWPEAFFGVFIIKITRKTNFMYILCCMLWYLKEYFCFFRY